MQGFSWSECPYSPGTYRRCDWLDGWDEEDALARDSKR
jgi:ribosome modulation factor